MWIRRGFLVVALGGLLALAAAGAEGPKKGPPPTTPTRIAFTGPELVKLDWGAPVIAVGDVNGDGLLDLLSPNPAKARIECLLQRPPGEPASRETKEPGSESDDVNALPDESRFERRPLAVELRVFSVVSADFTGDGRDDLAYYGEPNKLILLEQTDQGTWGKRHTFELPDGSRNPGGLAAGDFDGDGLTDIALVGRKVLHLICHEENGQFAPAKKIPASAEGSGFLLAADFDGDGRLDLAYPVSQQETPLCFRLQDAQGNLGPEQFAEMPRFRAAAALRRADEANATLGIILATSGRLELRRLALQEKTGAAEDQASPLLYPLEEDKSDRRFAVCDVDGDGRLDVVATYPSTAQVGVLFQREAGGLRQPVLYPCLSGVSELTTGDLDGDGRPELVVLSKEEETIGFSRWRAAKEGSGRLDFPRSVPLAGRPQAVAVGDVNGDGRDEVFYVRKEDKTYYLAWRGDRVGYRRVGLGGLGPDRRRAPGHSRIPFLRPRPAAPGRRRRWVSRRSRRGRTLSGPPASAEPGLHQPGRHRRRRPGRTADRGKELRPGHRRLRGRLGQRGGAGQRQERPFPDRLGHGRGPGR